MAIPNILNAPVTSDELDTYTLATMMTDECSLPDKSENVGRFDTSTQIFVP